LITPPNSAFDTSGELAMLGRVSDRRRRLAVPAIALVLLAGGCSDDDGGEEETTSEPADRVGAPTLRQQPADLDVEIARLSGALPKAAARDLSQRLGRVVATWFDGGFLTGDYPRKNFAGYASFTPDAARLARRDAGVTSNAQLGSQWVQVVPTRQVVRLYVFAPAHRPSGATARIELVMVGMDDSGTASELAVTGELFLTNTDNGWRIFGYDLQRSVGKPGAYVARQRAQHEQPEKPKAKKPKPRHQTGQREGGR
jgi:hypothetical protein